MLLFLKLSFSKSPLCQPRLSLASGLLLLLKLLVPFNWLVFNAFCFSDSLVSFEGCGADLFQTWTFPMLSPLCSPPTAGCSPARWRRRAEESQSLSRVRTSARRRRTFPLPPGVHCRHCHRPPATQGETFPALPSVRLSGLRALRGWRLRGLRFPLLWSPVREKAGGWRLAAGYGQGPRGG